MICQVFTSNTIKTDKKKRKKADKSDYLFYILPYISLFL